MTANKYVIWRYGQEIIHAHQYFDGTAIGNVSHRRTRGIAFHLQTRKGPVHSNTNTHYVII